MRTIPLGIAVALEFTGPLLVATLSSRRARDFVWVALAVAGILLLSPLVHAHDPLDPTGVLLALGAGGCWALYIVFAQKAGAELGVRTTAWGMAIAALVALPFGIAGVEPVLSQPSIQMSAMRVGLLSSTLPFWLYSVRMTVKPASGYGMLSCLGSATRSPPSSPRECSAWATSWVRCSGSCRRCCRSGRSG